MKASSGRGCATSADIFLDFGHARHEMPRLLIVVKAKRKLFADDRCLTPHFGFNGNAHT
jgi:hypothetical protein